MEQQGTHQPDPTPTRQPTQVRQQPQVDDLLPAIEIVMKSIGDGCAFSPESPMVVAKLCEMLIRDLTMRARRHAEANERTVLEKRDVDAAVAASADFLVDSKDNAPPQSADDA